MINTYKQIEIEAYENSSFGLWECPVCGSEFAGGGPAIHRGNCSARGYEGLIYHYTKAEKSKWNKEVLEKGCVAHLPLSPIGLSDYFLIQSILTGEQRIEEIIAKTIYYVEPINKQVLPGILENLRRLIDAETQKKSTNGPPFAATHQPPILRSSQTGQT